MPNTALNRSTVAVKTNKSGGAHAQGDVCVEGTSTANSVVNNTAGAFTSGMVWVCIEPNGVADNASGLYACGGYVPKINLNASASLGDFFKTHTVAKQATPHAAPMATGDFGQVLGTGTSPAAILFAVKPSGSAGVARSGSTTDGHLAVWDGTNADSIKDGGVAGAGGRTLISEQTPTGTGTVTWSGISGSYKKLTLEFAVRSTQAAAAVNGKINLNGDTTAGNYRYTEHFAYGTTTVGANGGDDCIFTTGISGGSAPAGSFSTGKIEIIQYANTNFNKQVGYSGNHRRDASSLFEITYRASVEWENTAAITQIDIILSAGNFAAGSVLRLYGEN